MFRDAEVAMADMYAGKCSDAQAKELDAAFWDDLDERIEHGREVYGGEGGACETHGGEESPRDGRRTYYCGLCLACVYLYTLFAV